MGIRFFAVRKGGVFSDEEKEALNAIARDEWGEGE